MHRADVFLFDLDGTLTKRELLPLIAESVGLHDEIRELTRLTMDGLIDFAASFRMRVQLLGSVPPEEVAEVVLGVPVHEDLMDWVSRRSDQCFVVTGNLDCWINPWLARWGLRGFSSKATVTPDGIRVKPQDILRKEGVLSHWTSQRIVAVGDGANDAALLGAADFGIAAELVHPVPAVVLDSSDCLIADETTLCRTLSRL